MLGRALDASPESYGSNTRKYQRRIDAGSLEPVIDVVMPLAEAAAAQMRLEARAQFGKIVLTP